jgi:hypothetical protein
LEQIRIEFDASDAVAHRFVVLRFDNAVRDDSRPKALDGLDRAAAGSIVLDVELQLFDYCGRDPAGTDLIARERLLVQHQHVDAGAFSEAMRRWSLPGHRLRSVLRSVACQDL